MNPISTIVYNELAELLTLTVILFLQNLLYTHPILTINKFQSYVN